MISARDISPVPRWLENTLLCIVLGLIVLRAMIIESPHIDQPQTRMFLSSEIVSLLISTVLLVCVGLWLFVSILCNRFRWRKTGFGIAVCVFIFAGVVSAVFASDKRAAVTDLITLATPMVGALLLVQLLTSTVRIRLALLLILSVGVAATIQCVDQKMESNEMLIAEYEADPVEFLQKQGIEPDGMEHWMYEHRLYSKDIRGFLMTSNSAASFFLLAVFAGLGLCLQVVRQKMSQEAMAALACYVLAFVTVLLGLFLTQSKGGIGAFMLGVILFVLLLVFGRTIWKQRRVVGIVALLVIVVGTGLVIAHGLHHGRLPGGTSMLVRWQYWESTAQMAKAILEGVREEGVEVKLMNITKTGRTAIMKEVLDAKALLIGSPTLNNGMYPTVADFLCYMKGLRPQGKIGLAFGSFGWGGGATKAIEEELKATGVEIIEPALHYQFLPDKEELNQCKELGKKVALRVKQ